MCFFVTYLFVFLVIKLIIQCWLLYSYFNIFTYYVCLFCSRFVVNIMKFDANVIQVRNLASYKTRSNPPFCTKENMTVVIHSFDVFQLLDFLFWNFLGFQYFCYFTCFDTCILALHKVMFFSDFLEVFWLIM